MLDGIDHFVIYSGDAEETIRFYRDTLGCIVRGEDEWRRGERPVFALQMGPVGPYVNVHPNGRELHPRAAHALPGTADLCIRVTISAAAVVEHLGRHGTPIEVGPAPRVDMFDQPAVSFYVRDPDGNLVELMARDESNERRSNT